MKKLNNKDIEIAVEIDGVYAQGFGMLAQKVMLDKELPLQSKAIYAYLLLMQVQVKFIQNAEQYFVT